MGGSRGAPGCAATRCAVAAVVRRSRHTRMRTHAQVKCVPWLPSEPWAKRPLDLVPVRAAMAAPVVTLREHVKVEDLRQARTRPVHPQTPVPRYLFSGFLTSSTIRKCMRASACLGDTPKAGDGVLKALMGCAKLSAVRDAFLAPVLLTDVV